MSVTYPFLGGGAARGRRGAARGCWSTGRPTTCGAPSPPCDLRAARFFLTSCFNPNSRGKKRGPPVPPPKKDVGSGRGIWTWDVWLTAPSLFEIKKRRVKSDSSKKELNPTQSEAAWKNLKCNGNYSQKEHHRASGSVSNIEKKNIKSRIKEHNFDAGWKLRIRHTERS